MNLRNQVHLNVLLCLNSMNELQVLEAKDVSHLDEVLKPNGILECLPSSVYETIPLNDLRLWCHANAVYGLPTHELIQFLKDVFIGATIEIGAGDGVFGRSLGVQSTDSYIQSDPKMAILYRLMGQPVVKYGANVEKIEALDAVRKYKPDTVFGSWVTQYVSPEENIDVTGCMAGIDEVAMSKLVQRYIVFGNEKVHKDKKIFKLPNVSVQTHQCPKWWSRSSSQDLNRVWIFDFK